MTNTNETKTSVNLENGCAQSPAGGNRKQQQQNRHNTPTGGGKRKSCRKSAQGLEAEEAAVLNTNALDPEEATTATGASNAANGSSAGVAVALPPAVLNKLYHSYSIKQRRSGLKWFLFASMLFELWAVIIPQGQCMEALAVTLAALCFNIFVCVILHVSYVLQKRQTAAPCLAAFHEHLLQFVPHALWAVCVGQLVAYVMLQEVTASPRDILGWGILLNFLIYVTLPVTLLYAGCILGLGTMGVFGSLMFWGSRRDPQFSQQLLANTVLLVAAAAIGLLYYFLGEAKQKRAFLEARRSLEMKMLIEEQSAEQERLLLSVLPKHVAVKMRQDLGSTSSEPFKKIYMSRHENVSILYADIVGFTAISSTYSAQDLVKMLNELFARFDRLSEKYQQLRIKILGDCYYCISGAPDERPDHAVLCVHMGLSMVKAIKYVQQKANSPVDMRVGIHTGAILAGILGQRQWQFDVYSKDVELANKMESSGKAGRVHISDKTLAFLSGEFEVEPAFGERREEALRIAGLKTFFIVKVLKPFASPSTRQMNETQNGALNENGVELLNGNNKADTAAVDDDDDDADDDCDDDELVANGNGSAALTAAGESGQELADMATLDKQAVFKQRLQEELVARDGHQNLSKATTVFLKFKDDKLESTYATYREPFSSLPLVAALFVQCIDVLYSYIVLPSSTLHFVNISAPLVPLLMLVFISIAENFPRQLPGFFVSLSKRFNDITFVRELTAIIIAVTIGLSNIIDMYFYVTFLKTEHVVSTEAEFNLTTGTIDGAAAAAAAAIIDQGYILAPAALIIGDASGNGVGGGDDTVALDKIEMLEAAATEEPMMYPSYMSNFGVLILIAIAVIAQLTHASKIVLMTVIAGLHCYANVFILGDLYSLEDELAFNPVIPTCFCTSAILLLATLALSFFARHLDHEDRVIFRWKTEVAEQKEMATDMRTRNEALVYNILPVHVAEHFMKNTKRSHDDLYSQSYSEVGVLFASMPNFSDFYSEETVNNQGLECLRFLNEVISDFDALLELPQFQDIIKIKTIGSTYMAAAGINSNRIALPDEPITKRWAHLAVLVEFALELKKALQGINEQSFNHFVLKMGINHGPITAGVIGARKPHYDIWGNTVNVASRMESTGKAGNIQVTEETCNILQQFGYTFLQRGLVSVKGKGELMTYYLQGKAVAGGGGGPGPGPGLSSAAAGGGDNCGIHSNRPSPRPSSKMARDELPAVQLDIQHHHSDVGGELKPSSATVEEAGVKTPLLEGRSHGGDFGTAPAAGDVAASLAALVDGVKGGEEQEALIN